MDQKTAIPAAQEQGKTLLLTLLPLFFLLIASPVTCSAAGGTLDPNNCYFFSVTDYGSEGVRSIDFSLVPSTEPTPATVEVPPPAAGSPGGVVPIHLMAPQGFGVVKAQFFVNGAKVGEKTAAPFHFSWDTTNQAGGQYQVAVKAFDAAGNAALSGNVTVQVAGDKVLPFMKRLSLATGSSSVTIKLEASDNAGVAKVELYVDNGLQLSKAASYLSYVWTSSVKKTQTITVKMYDASGNMRSLSFNLAKI